MRRGFAFPAALGAGLMFFFDPHSGNRRRAMLRERTAGLLRRGWRRMGRAGRAVSAEAYGVSQRVQHLQEAPKEQPDDATLARKVETEIFRPASAPKGAVDVNAENGVVYLRGEVDTSDMVRDLEKAARCVQGVKDVENLLHLPGTPAPMKQ
jgi:osmotically-inducible protein OsmY